MKWARDDVASDPKWYSYWKFKALSCIAQIMKGSDVRARDGQSTFDYTLGHARNPATVGKYSSPFSWGTLC